MLQKSCCFFNIALPLLGLILVPLSARQHKLRAWHTEKIGDFWGSTNLEPPKGKSSGAPHARMCPRIHHPLLMLYRKQQDPPKSHSEALGVESFSQP